MLPEKYRWIGVQFEPGEGDPDLLLAVAEELEDEGNRAGAAQVLDRAFGIAPAHEAVRRAQARPGQPGGGRARPDIPLHPGRRVPDGLRHTRAR